MDKQQLLDFLSSPELRIGLAALLVILLIGLNLLTIKLTKRLTKLGKAINIGLVIVIISIIISLFIFSESDFNWIEYIPTFETRIITIFISSVILLILNGIRILKKAPANRYVKSLNISLLIFIGLTILPTIFLRPQIIQTSPNSGVVLTDASPVIEIEFDVPVDYKNVEFNISPEINGDWQWEAVLEGTVLKRKATFIPKESFYPGNPVVVYVTGIRTLWWQPKSHEYSLELNSPNIPEFVQSNPYNNQNDIPINSDIVLEFDEPLGEFVDLKVEFTPPIEYESSFNGNNKIIKFVEALKQDQKYDVVIHRTERSYDTKTNEDIILGDTKELTKFSFETVSTPLLEGYSPKGDTVLIDSEIELIFDQDMDRETVVENLSITPEIEYEVQWEGDNKLYIVPNNALNKATKYTLVITNEAESIVGGKIGSDINIEFTTIGYITVKSFFNLSKCIWIFCMGWK
jgi:hypothetical protein